RLPYALGAPGRFREEALVLCEHRNDLTGAVVVEPVDLPADGVNLEARGRCGLVHRPSTSQHQAEGARVAVSDAHPTDGQPVLLDRSLDGVPATVDRQPGGRLGRLIEDP